MLAKIFTDHPRMTGETYLEHQRFATGVGLRLIAAGLAALVHGIVPCLLKSTAGDTIRSLNATIQARGQPKTQAEGCGAVP